MKHARWAALLVVMLAAIAALYRMRWHTLAGFVTAIDHDSAFMQDFITHYWPTGHQVLSHPAPVAGYYYSAFFALLLAPFGALDLPAATLAWAALQVALLAAFCVTCARGLLRFGPLATVAFTGLCLTSFPVLHNLRWGQVSVLVALCVAGAFAAAHGKRRVLAGVLLAFATAIKLYPALFILYFVIDRDARTCASFAIAALVFYVLLPVAVLGAGPWWAFELASRAGIERAQWTQGDVNSQYFVHVGLRLVSLLAHHVGGRGMAGALAAFGALSAAGCVALALALRRRESCRAYSLPLMALFLALPFVVRTSWPHYFAWLPLGQAAVLGWSLRAAGPARALALLPLASIALASVFGFWCFPGWNAYSSYGALFVSQLPLLVALVVAVVLTPEDSSVRRNAQGLNP